MAEYDNPQMIRNSLQGLITTYGAAIQQAEGAQELLNKLVLAITLKEPFLDRVDLLDKAFAQHTAFEPIKEAAFDLFMVYFLSMEAGQLDDYFDTEEWAAIEQETIDRGTEMLNVIIYLHESNADDVQPGIDDFLEEFLLVDDDEFQDEHHIYETLITHRESMNGKLEDLFQVSRELPQDDALKELFLPISLVLREKPLPEGINGILQKESDMPAIHGAYLSALLPFRKS